MSWVRWSTEVSKGKTSDLYIYDHCDGYVAVHVAGRKRVPLYPDEQIPDSPDLGQLSADVDKWSKQCQIAEDWWSEVNENINWKWETVNEKWAGENLDFTDMDSFVDTLTEMRKDGLVFPDYVFEIAKEEAK